MIVQPLRAWLLSDTAISNVVGLRVFPLRADQGSDYPLVILQQVSMTPELHSLGETGLVQTRLQITAWAKTYKVARELGELIRLRISGYTGELGVTEGTLPGVQSIELEGQFDLDDSMPGLDTLTHFGVATDYLIWHAQGVPVHNEEEE